MTSADIKITLLNSFSLLASFSNIESGLKIILLLASIIYTGMKIAEQLKSKKDGDKTNP